MPKPDHTFHACPDCGALVRDDWVEVHAAREEEIQQLLTAEPAKDQLALDEWPADEAPAAVADDPLGRGL